MASPTAEREDLLTVRLPVPPTVENLATVTGYSEQYVHRTPLLVRSGRRAGRRVTFTISSTEEFLREHGLAVRWVDPLSGQEIDPVSGELV